MEDKNCLLALTYKGSIPQAIIESKNQKKLFVVYISGVDDAVSVELEKSVWTDSKVGESVSKYCILLHLQEGSSDAVNFSAIFPYSAVPSIIAVGYNGVQLWKSEGFISAEVLASSLETAWLSLQIQETTATVMTAALASKKTELSNIGSSDVGSSEKGVSSGTVVPSPPVDKDVRSSETSPPVPSEMTSEDNSHENFVKEKSATKFDDESSKSSRADKSRSIGFEKSTSPGEEDKGVPTPMIIDRKNSLGHDMSCTIEDGHPVQEKMGNADDFQASIDEKDGAKDVGKETVKDDTIDDDKMASAPIDVHLNIRLPSGDSLQDKFPLTNTLRMVKDYVDWNQTSGLGSYDLAIPYPRKVFGNEDLNKSLSELGLFNRQALIVVPRQKSTSYRGGGSFNQATATHSDSSTPSNGGYFAYVKSMLSYFNPLSYLGGSSSSSTSSSGQPQAGMWEYNPNPALRDNLTGTQRSKPSNFQTQDPSATVRGDQRSGRPTSRIGSNIHTLKHDEDDAQFNDRNSFWNGNSTQYGGNSDNK